MTTSKSQKKVASQRYPRGDQPKISTEELKRLADKPVRTLDETAAISDELLRASRTRGFFSDRPFPTGKEESLNQTFAIAMPVQKKMEERDAGSQRGRSVGGTKAARTRQQQGFSNELLRKDVNALLRIDATRRGLALRLKQRLPSRYNYSLDYIRRRIKALCDES